MKKTSIIIAAALLAAGMSSCNKNEDSVRVDFTAITSQPEGDKTHLGEDGLTINWSENDQIAIVVSGLGYPATANTFGSNSTTFHYDDPDLDPSMVTGPYTAIYPSTICTGDASISLPAVQSSVDGSLTGFPMYAYSTTNNLQFKNLCSVMKITVNGTYANRIRRIDITANAPLAGDFNLNGTGNSEVAPTLSATAENNSYSVTLQVTGENTSGNYYLYLPAGTYSSFVIKFTADNGYVCTKTANSPRPFEQNKVHPYNFTSLSFAPEGAINGLFSVSATKQVYFSKGNLQYVSGIWKFATHQYDCLGITNYDYSTAWELFGWSTAVSRYGYSMSTNNSTYYGDFVDWGMNPISNGGNITTDGTVNEDMWYTLTIGEWSYLFDSRANAANLKGHATVNGIYGVVLLPDIFTLPTDLPAFVAGYSSGWNTNTYTATEWEQMEAAGAVFLSAAGYRYGTSVYYTGSDGNYWSATPYGTNFAYIVYIGSSYLNTRNDCYRYDARSVRLVQNAQ